MRHLIPLVLGVPSDHTQTNSRPMSTSSPTVLLPILPSSPTLADPDPVQLMVPEALPTKTQERLITLPRPNPVTDLIIMPHTQHEWQKVMDEVRPLYLRRQYKHCSARCIQILDGIEDPYRVHPVYSIYLCFYAATCLEMIARSLHANSSENIPLLQSSLDYYSQAELYMEYAMFSADPTIVSSTRERSSAHLHSTSSSASSQRSSIDSIFSVISSTSSTAESSPISSVFPTEPAEKDDVFVHTPTPILVRPRPFSESELKPAPLKLKKKVSFYLPADVSPKTLLSTPARVVSSPACLLSKPAILSQYRSATPSQSQPFVAAAATPPEHNPASITSYLLSRSVMNYRTHLSAFSTQLTYHQNTVTSLITQIQTARKARRSNTPEIFTDFTNRIMDFAAGCLEGDGSGGVDSEERKRKELEERRRRLRDSGWRRQRFCGEKYERLCEIALSELEESGYPQAI